MALHYTCLWAAWFAHLAAWRVNWAIPLTSSARPGGFGAAGSPEAAQNKNVYLEVLLTTRLDTLGRGQGKPPHFWAEVRGGPTYGEKWPHYLAEVGGRTPTSGKKWGATPPLLGRSRGGGGSGASPEQVQGQALNRGGGGEVQG